MLESIRGDIRVVVWPDHRLLYVRVPKSGNTSISAAVPDGKKRRVNSRRLAKTHAGWLTFSFVRNPWSRLISTYSQKVDLEMANQAKMVDGVFQGFRKLGMPIRPDMPFAEFAEMVCELPDERTDKHLKSQSYFLVRRGEIVPDFIGKVEHMDDDWKRVMERAGIAYELPHLNRTRSKPTASYFSDSALRNLVGDRYREDVERFGYDAPA